MASARECELLYVTGGVGASHRKGSAHVLSIASTTESTQSSSPAWSEWPSEMSSSPSDEFETCTAGLVVGDVIGQGATADVFAGSLFGQAVAVKQAKSGPDGRISSAVERALLREAAVLTRLRHNNILGLIGTPSVDRPLCIVTGLCTGGALFDLLHTSCVDLQWHQQLRIASDVAQAMKYLHELSPAIIHRDLKSPNVLLASEVTTEECVPVAKVADFGLSREWRPDSLMTVGAGTIHWMAPEVAAGHRYDCKADVFSFGMLFFEIVCLEVPFEDTPAHEVLELIAKGVRPDRDPDALPPDCPAPLSKTMAACWAQDPADRPSWDSVIDTISCILSEAL